MFVNDSNFIMNLATSGVVSAYSGAVTVNHCTFFLNKADLHKSVGTLIARNCVSTNAFSAAFSGSDSGNIVNEAPDLNPIPAVYPVCELLTICSPPPNPDPGPPESPVTPEEGASRSSGFDATSLRGSYTLTQSYFQSPSIAFASVAAFRDTALTESKLINFSAFLDSPFRFQSDELSQTSVLCSDILLWSYSGNHSTVFRSTLSLQSPSAAPGTAVSESFSEPAVDNVSLSFAIDSPSASSSFLVSAFARLSGVRNSRAFCDSHSAASIVPTDGLSLAFSYSPTFAVSLQAPPEHPFEPMTQTSAVDAVDAGTRPGIVAGLIIAGIAGVVLIIAVIVWIRYRNRNQAPPPPIPQTDSREQVSSWIDEGHELSLSAYVNVLTCDDEGPSDLWQVSHSHDVE
jgi:hypothetical protein